MSHSSNWKRLLSKARDLFRFEARVCPFCNAKNNLGDSKLRGGCLAATLEERRLPEAWQCGSCQAWVTAEDEDF